MLPPAVLHPTNEAQVLFDAHLDAHVVLVGGVDLLAGTAAECACLLDEWVWWAAETWRVMMSPVLGGWVEAQVA